MSSSDQTTTAIIVGAGPSGLATAACLHQLSIPYTILEREDCIASTFNKKSYNRLHLHLQKQFCQLPHLPFPDNYPNYVSKRDFLKYLDDYALSFEIKPRFGHFVTSAKYDENTRKWEVESRVGDEGLIECYSARFLVVATGENCEAFMPEVEGLGEFKGEVIHSSEYKSGKGYEDKAVLVVGSGNSGMEIALDLCNYGARTSIVIRSPIHIISRWSANLGLKLFKFIPPHMVDSLLVLLSKVTYGDLTKYGIQRPKQGPFFLKGQYGKYPIFDVGTLKKIKSREIQVFSTLKSIRSGGNEVVFENEKCCQFDAIIFATGFKRSTHLWLKGDESLLNEDGLPISPYPNHWKGEDGIYSVGLTRMGLYGAAMDAQNIAQHISSLISN